MVGPMDREFTILIADRNPHVREFLKREMMAEGYQVRLAKSGREVLKWVYHNEPLDLLILDYDLPDIGGETVMKKVEDRIPTIPVVVHAFPSDCTNYRPVLSSTVFVEKKGNSVEGLKKIVSDMVRNAYLQDSDSNNT